VELIYAIQNKIPYGSVQNSSGNFVKASIDSVTAAASTAKIPADYRYSITNAPGKDAFPISGTTWLLIPAHSRDAAKGKELLDFVNWVLTNGQDMEASLDYAKLPSNLVSRLKETLKQVK
jgi:phosphate transport system substrate-binding protein